MNKQKRVLLVDDEVPVREALARLLTVENYAVISAANGGQARRAASENPADIALLDVNLQEENGWELAQDLLAMHPALPIVMITAQPDQSLHPLAPNVGAVMLKPLELDLLLGKIAQLVSRSAETQPLELPLKRTNYFVYNCEGREKHHEVF